MTVWDITLLAAFAIVAVLYSAVGQAGGTGYIAAMGLLGFAPNIIKPTALALNILVAAIGCVRFCRVGLLTWRSCYPFAILGAPFSLLGGAINLPAVIYQPVVGALLLLAALQMMRSAAGAADADERAPREPPFLLSLLTGGLIGLVSGVTGVGGGIFLAPLVLTMGWVATRQAAAVSAAFNLLNSASGLPAFGRRCRRYRSNYRFGWLSWASARSSGRGLARTDCRQRHCGSFSRACWSRQGCE